MNQQAMLPKLATGIDGFDHLSGGGLPEGRVTLVIGGPGSGKTVFALQTMVNGARDRQLPGIFVAFEEPPRDIRANAASFGWDLAGLEADRLFFLDARPSAAVVESGGFDLSGMLAMLQAKADEIGAGWIVFDGVDVLLTLLQDPHLELREISRIHDWLRETGLTCILTAKAGDQVGTDSHYGSMQFMADCTIRLDRRLEGGISVHRLQIAKYRGSDFVGGEHSIGIGSSGMAVMAPAGEIRHRASTERISAGFERLDTMLGGGIYRGSSTLVTGSPGTAKTTLAATFAAASCRAGEPTLFVSFDEGAEPIMRNLRSVGIDLRAHERSGLLRMYAARVDTDPEAQLRQIISLLDEHRATCMVIDPLSALSRVGGIDAARDVANRLMYLVKDRMVTAMLTGLVDGNDPVIEATDLQVSTIADTWIHLSYVIHAGERNRALTIVKSRGTRHSNQVRELILTRDGPTLADVYTRGGEVLMGTLRWEREAEDLAAMREQEAAYEQKRLELQSARAVTEAQIIALKHELERQRSELESLQLTHAARLRTDTDREQQVRELRAGDVAAAEAEPLPERC